MIRRHTIFYMKLQEKNTKKERDCVKDQSAVDASSINAFKNCLERVRSNRMGFFMD